MIESFRAFIGTNQMMAYLVMMAAIQRMVAGRSGDTPVPMSAKHEDGLAGGTGDGDKSVPAPFYRVIGQPEGLLNTIR